MRLLVILAMAACGGANLAAGLLSVTTDDPAYALSYAAAIGVALVALGAAAGHMLRRWELNAQRPRDHVARGSRVPVLVVVLGLVFAVGLVAAVASIRATGALAEAQRWAEAQAPLEFVLPDASPDDTAGTPGTVEATPPTIPPLAWGVLEGVLVTGALLIEYAGTLPWAARHAELQKRCRRRRVAWERRRAALARAVAHLKTAWDIRADRDAAVKEREEEPNPALRIISSVSPEYSRTFDDGIVASQPEFESGQDLRGLIELTERRDLLASVLTGARQQGLQISIGAENEAPELNTFTLVTSEYRVGNLSGVIGVIGPTRMPYDKVVTIVASTSRIVSELFTGSKEPRGGAGD